MKTLLALILATLTLYGCNTCKTIPAYGGRAPMTQGHPKQAFEQRASANPYYSKPKTIKSHYRNPML